MYASIIPSTRKLPFKSYLTHISFINHFQFLTANKLKKTPYTTANVLKIQFSPATAAVATFNKHKTLYRGGEERKLGTNIMQICTKWQITKGNWSQHSQHAGAIMSCVLRRQLRRSSPTQECVHIDTQTRTHIHTHAHINTVICVLC